MVVPASIYLIFNPVGKPTPAGNQWQPTSLLHWGFYIFWRKSADFTESVSAALAIVDDLGAVIVIAFFYTSDISISSLLIGLGFVAVMYIANKAGVRNILFFAILGIGGVWTAFLLSGVHATIASVLAAFTIPANMEINENIYFTKIKKSLKKFISIDPNDDIPTLTNEQLHLLEDIKKETNRLCRRFSGWNMQCTRL